MRRALVSAFADFPEFDFIWKLDNSHELVNDETTRALFASATNVHLFDWVEQNAILSAHIHPSIHSISKYPFRPIQGIPFSAVLCHIVVKTV